MTSYENAYGASKSSIKYWQISRRKLDDLYKSERYFFEDAVRNCKTALDIGCAAGGFSMICKSLNPAIQYVGIDSSNELITAARDSYPEKSDMFKCFDGYNIPYANDSFELVFSFGVLHHLLHWEDMLQQMYLKATKYVLFDVRLTQGDTIKDPEKSFQKVAFNEKWDGKTKVPYIVVNENYMTKLLSRISSDADRIQCYGYHCEPTKDATLTCSDLKMMAFLIEKA